MKAIRIATSAVAACLALSACAQVGTGTSPSPNPSGGASVTTPSAQPSPGDPALPRPTRLPTRPPGGVTPSGTVTVTGTVTAGVEPNCLLLDGYLLVNGPRELLQSGARVTVTGRVQSDLMTTCQQGIPLIVESAERA